MREIENTEQSIYSIMREMDMNKQLIVPIENWTLVRNYAQQIESKKRVIFSVRRMMTSHTKKNFILIERTA